ncbi:MAG: MBL fold metallo-hydrolase [Candidatus Eremiobacteraeota bacterium]|nr:MBL fold metallo-hydrolase [Candidatus Eremiobacteraeota bacterium]
METRVDEIAPQIYRISTFIPQSGLVFNQFFVDAEEPLLFHTGMSALFPIVSEHVKRVLDPSRLRWIMFGHYEADECGAMNRWLEVAPSATVAHSAVGIMTSINDQALRPGRPMQSGDTIDLGGKRIRYIATPHVPHGWDAGVIYEETTRTLFAGDLFTRLGKGTHTTDASILEPALDAEDRFGATALTPATAPTIRNLADLDIATLALMHAPAFTGDASKELQQLADAYETRLQAATP